MSDVAPSMIEIGFLRRLDAGVEYGDAVNACGPEGLRVAFNATLNGWVDRGRITEVGRVLIVPTVTILRTTEAKSGNEQKGKET